MAVVINARGTSSSRFQLGKNGPIVKNNGGIIEFRDSTDTSYVELRSDGENPTNPNALTSKSYVDSVASGLSVKDSVRAATATLSDMQDYVYQASNDDNTTATPLVWERTGQGAVFDGITLADGDRVLIKESSDARGHGIFTYVADTGAGDSGFRRAQDSDNTPESELQGGTFTFVSEGVTQNSDGFVISSPNGTITLGTDDIVWSQFLGGSSSTGAGDGLTKTSNTLNVGGTTGRIVVTSDAVDLASVIQNFESTGIDDNASNTSITINSSQSVGIKDSSPAFSLSVGGTDGILLPVGTTAQQPGSPETGLLRYNSSTSKLELYDGSFSNVATESFVSANYQSLDSDLTALANTSSTGLYVRTGSGTSATRSITGTTDEITLTNGDGTSGNPTISIASNPVLPGVQGVELPKGTTAQRPSSPAAGVTRWNTSDDKIESYNGSIWLQAAFENQSNTFDTTTFEDQVTIRRNTFAPQLVLENSNATGSGSVAYFDTDSLIFRTVDTEQARIASNGNFGIGTDNPGGKTHISTGSSGATAAAGADELVLEHAGTFGGMSILSGDSATSQIGFADTTDALAGRIEYDHANDHMAIFTAVSERMRVDSSGRLLLGTTSNPGYTGLGDLVVSRAGDSGIVLEAGTSNISRLAFGDGGDNTLIGWVEYDHAIDTLGLTAGGQTKAEFGSTDTFMQGINDNTTASTANVFVDSSTGLLQRSTSSRKYKTNIQDYNKGIEEVEKLEPKSFNSVNENDSHTYAGLIAEEVADAGLSEYVIYDENGEPDALHYSHIVALLINANKELNKKVEDLQRQINEMKS